MWKTTNSNLETIEASLSIQSTHGTLEYLLLEESVCIQKETMREGRITIYHEVRLLELGTKKPTA